MKNNTPQEQLDRLGLFFCAIASPLIEITEGVRTGTLPWIECLSMCVAIQLALLVGLDTLLFSDTVSMWLRSTPTRNHVYYFCMASLPFVLWGLIQSARKRQLTTRLTQVFVACGLRNKLGKFPNFVFDRALDTSTRKLRLTRAVLDLKDFEKAKGALEGGLQIYIDEFRENRIGGTVDMIYSNLPMPAKYVLSNVGCIPKGKFVIGTTRSVEVRVDIESVPHLLVAGQTGGGKSTFLRQFIATQYLNDRTARFVLVDLKGGMEFQLFERLPRVVVPENTKLALEEIETLSETLEKRMALLKLHKCKDIQEFQAKDRESQRSSSRPSLHRHYVVVDEAAEMFLAGHHASGQDVQKAKRALSRVARQGRAVGIHLIVATQRPDSRALDPQIKANLTGALCFQMANDISSITVLGNGRATDLPAVPGRAIWKTGAEMIEVQTPFLTSSETEELLRPFYVERSEAAASPNTDKKSSGLSESSLVKEMEQDG
jgi:ABC-type ATPase involved in cell division